MNTTLRGHFILIFLVALGCKNSKPDITIQQTGQILDCIQIYYFIHGKLPSAHADILPITMQMGLDKEVLVRTSWKKTNSLAAGDIGVGLQMDGSVRNLSISDERFGCSWEFLSFIKAGSNRPSVYPCLENAVLNCGRVAYESFWESRGSRPSTKFAALSKDELETLAPFSKVLRWEFDSAKAPKWIIVRLPRDDGRIVIFSLSGPSGETSNIVIESSQQRK